MRDVSSKNDRMIQRLRTQTETIRTLIALPEGQLQAISPVSAWSAGQHLDHLLKVARAIMDHVVKPDGAVLPKGVNFVGRMVLTTGWIPRGRGKAPEKLRGAVATHEELVAALDRLVTMIGQIPLETLTLQKRATVPHPRFEALTPFQGLHFVVIHTGHHLRIVQEVLAAGKKAPAPA